MRRYKGSRREAVPTNQEKSQTRASTKSMPTKKPPFLQRAAFVVIQLVPDSELSFSSTTAGACISL